MPPCHGGEPGIDFPDDLELYLFLWIQFCVRASTCAYMPPMTWRSQIKHTGSLGPVVWQMQIDLYLSSRLQSMSSYQRISTMFAIRKRRIWRMFIPAILTWLIAYYMVNMPPCYGGEPGSIPGWVAHRTFAFRKVMEFSQIQVRCWSRPFDNQWEATSSRVQDLVWTRLSTMHSWQQFEIVHHKTSAMQFSREWETRN